MNGFPVCVTYSSVVYILAATGVTQVEIFLCFNIQEDTERKLKKQFFMCRSIDKLWTIVADILNVCICV
jgi:hypothetical protein